jgi:hypothetical protein
MNNKKTIYNLIKKYANLKINNFYIIKVDNEITTKIFIMFSLFYYELSLLKTLFMGIDFEFNNNIIALCQLSFYLNDFNVIFIYDPNIIDSYEKHSSSESNTEIIVYSLYTSNIIRIIHGGESLDIPYIYKTLLKNNRTSILEFTSTLVDTRFLCEYYKIYINYSDKKSNLYDALLFFKVIDKIEYKKLDSINNSNGPIYKINWNIKKLNKMQLLYALYDVLYLRKFILKIFNLAETEDYAYGLYEQLQIIIHLTRFIYYTKWIPDINELVINIKSKININAILFDKTIKNVYIPQNNLQISNLFEIEYFKSTLKIIFAYILTYILNPEINTNFKIYYEIFRKIKIGKIIVLIERFFQESKVYIKKFEYI